MANFTTRHPDPSVAGVELPEFERLRAELLRIAIQRTETNGLLGLHQRSKGSAEATDRMRYAAAIRNGEKDPGQKVEEAWKAKDAELRRKLAAEDAALELVAEEMRRDLAEQSAEYHARVDTRIAEAKDDLRLALEAYTTAREELMVAEELRQYLDGRMNPRSPRRNVMSQSLRARNGDPIPPTEVIDALRDDLALDVFRDTTIRLVSDFSGPEFKVGSTPGGGLRHAPRP